ncbi:host specificity protein [Salmonella phage 19]|nr:host specificity protein [Salmonella phage 19]
MESKTTRRVNNWNYEMGQMDREIDILATAWVSPDTLSSAGKFGLDATRKQRKIIAATGIECHMDH